MATAIRSLTKNKPAQRLLLAGALVILNALLLVYTESAGYAKPLAIFVFVVCSVSAVLDLRIAIGILLFIAAMDGFIKGWLGSTAYSLLMKDYFLALAVACWLSGRPWRQPDSSLHHPIRLPMIMLGIWVLAQFCNPYTEARYVASLAGARAWLVWLAVFFVVADMLAAPKMVALTVTWIMILAGVSGAYGILQHIFGFGFLGEASPEAMASASGYEWWTKTGQVVGRIYGTTVHPGAFGTFMGLAILLAVGSFMTATRWWARMLPIGAAIIAIAALLLSGTRTAMVAALAGLLSMALAGRNVRFPLLVAAIVVPGILLTGRLSQLAFERGLDVWHRRVYTFERGWEPLKWALSTGGEHPFGLGLDTGVGVPIVLGGRVAVDKAKMVENDFGRALVELGWPGLFVYGWLVWACLRTCYGSCMALRGQRPFPLAAAFLGCVVAVVVSLLTGPVLYVAPGALIFWACVAGGAALNRHAEALRPRETG